MTTIRAFFLQIRELFSNFWKRAGETYSLRLSSYMPVYKNVFCMVQVKIVAPAKLQIQ